MTKTPSQTRKILLIEDNEDIVEALEIILKSAGYVYTSILDSKDIGERAKAFAPDLIILDALLSGRDGPSVAGMLKAMPETKNTPIIMISAHPAIEKMAKEAGVNDFLPKPFDMQIFLRKIEQQFALV